MKKIGISIALAVGLVMVLIFGVNRFLAVYTHHAEKIPVPVLYGLEVPEVERLLDELGLRYEIRDSLFEEDKPRNAVLTQDPDTNEFVKEDRIIYISINASEIPKIRMPDLNHKNINQAIMIIESMGLKVGKIDTANDIMEDAVLEQKMNGKRIKANAEIVQGSVIDLVIGDGGNEQGVFGGDVDVPDLVGLSLGEARIILDAYGLRIGSVIARGAVKDMNEATVVAQIPSYSADLQIRKGSKLSVTIKQ